jgi:hypothetical protein
MLSCEKSAKNVLRECLSKTSAPDKCLTHSADQAVSEVLIEKAL